MDIGTFGGAAGMDDERAPTASLSPFIQEEQMEEHKDMSAKPAVTEGLKVKLKETGNVCTSCPSPNLMVPRSGTD